MKLTEKSGNHEGHFKQYPAEHIRRIKRKGDTRNGTLIRFIRTGGETMNSRTRKLIELAQRRLQESKQQQLTDEQRLLIQKLAEVYKLQLEIDDDTLTAELERLNTLERELIAKINETFTEEE